MSKVWLADVSAVLQKKPPYTNGLACFLPRGVLGLVPYHRLSKPHLCGWLE